MPASSRRNPHPAPLPKGEGTQTGEDQPYITVDRIGADGDGVAAISDGVPVYLPYTLPGENVRAAQLTRRGKAWAGFAEVLVPSADRQAAPCSHFGACGGCTLQHWQDAPYAAWKSDQLRAALSRAGYPDAALSPLARTPQQDRRRVDLAVSRENGRVQVGLHRHRSRDVVDLRTCLVIEPRLVALIGLLRQALAPLVGLRRAGSAIVNVLDSGLDLLLRTDAPLSARDRTLLADLAQQAGACRIAWALDKGPPETACQLAPATTMLAGAPVVVPPGAFLQASRSGEAAIIAAVIAALPRFRSGRDTIVELFAGCGTLTFALAEHARVLAFEGDPAAHTALRSAIDGRRIQATLRDLARQPLTTKELAAAATIVLDPPFAGAAAQMPAIAASGAARVIYVSCNPAALARDAQILRQAGYVLCAATPIDQFLWSAAVESVCVFERARAVCKTAVGSINVTAS